MAFRINRGIFKFYDPTSTTYKPRYKFEETSGKLVELDDDGNTVSDALTTAGGTVSGALTAPSYYVGSSNVQLHTGGNNALRITSPTGWVQFGSENSSYAHFNTDRATFYFNRQLEVAGHAKPYTDNTYNLGTSSLRWNNVYADSFRGYGDSIINGNLNVGGTITAQEFHTEFVNQTIIQETGDVQIDGQLSFSGAATTTDQAYGITWTAFDKEGTTDGSDAAYIKHTTNTGGHSGSVLVISSRNDSNDGIAFDTHASSPLKHNGSVIWSEGNNLYRVTSQDLNAATRTAWYSNYTSGDAANRVQNHSTVYTLGGVNTLQLSTNTDYDETALWFRQYNSNSASPNGTGWQSWKKVATEDWVTSQISSTSGISQATADGRYVRLTGGTNTINLNNQNITNVNSIAIGDPGPGEGLLLQGGNDWRIYESPNDLTTNSAGNLQFVRATTRVMTLNTDHNVEIPNKLLIGGANDNGGKADFAVGNSTQVSWLSNQVQIGGTDMNWGGKAYYSSGFHIGAWDVNLRLFTQGGANNRDIEIAPQRNGSPTEVARFKGEGYMYFPGLEFAISTVNSDHGIANYFRGSNTHLVIGTGGTLYLNYGNSGGDTRMYGTIWHNDVNIGTPWGSGNDGAGSGLDADNLDGSTWTSTNKTVRWSSGTGYHGNPRSMAIGYSGGNYGQFGYGLDFTSTSGVHTYAINDIATRVDMFGGLIVYGAPGGVVGTNITWTETFRARYTDSAPTFKGNTIWHAGNDGSGSGLDADRLDGLDSTQFLRRDTDTSFTGGTFTFTKAQSTPKLLFNGHGGASSYNHFISAANDTGNKAVHFVNGSTRTADGGANTYTIRNDAGPLRLGLNTYTTVIEGSIVTMPNRLGIGTTTPSSSYRLSFGGGGIYMANNPVHYVSELHFNGNTRFQDSGNNNYTILRAGSDSHGGLQFTTNGVTRGYLYHNNSNHVGLLDAGGSWAVKHRNDEGTQFYTDGETLEFTVGRDLVTGNYGTVQTSTTRSSWGGYSINGQYVFMSDHSNRVGIFNDVDNEWMLEATRNADLKLYHNGTVRLTTTGSGVTINGYIQSDAPAAPSVTAANIVGDTIEVVFNASATGNIDYYQVWSSVAGGSYGLIAQIPQSDFAATMTVIDSTFSVSGTIDYRVYAVKSGVYSAPGTISQTYTTPALDVVGMSVVNLNTAYYIQYDLPDSRFVDHIEIYMDAEANSANLTRTGATLVYSGDNTSYMYQVGAADLDKYHQFWVEVIES